MTAASAAGSSAASRPAWACSTRIRSRWSASTTSRAGRRRALPPRLPRVRHRGRGAHVRRNGPGRHLRYELLQGLADGAKRAPGPADRHAAFRRRGGLLQPARPARPRVRAVADATGAHATACANSSAPLRPAPPAGHRGVAGDRPLPAAQDRGADLRSSPAPGTRSSMPCSTTAPSRRPRRGGRRAPQRLNFWGTLALLRCVASSPRRPSRRCAPEPAEVLDAEDRREILGPGVRRRRRSPARGRRRAPRRDRGCRARGAHRRRPRRLAGQAGDPKLKALTEHLAELLDARASAGGVLPLHRHRALPRPTTSRSSSRRPPSMSSPANSRRRSARPAWPARRP